MGFLLVIIIASFTILVSCDETFNLNSEWSDITIVHGVLNNSDSAHYIKINKAFLGNESAYEMAKIADSIQYADEVSVQLVEYKLINEQDPFNEKSWELSSREPIVFYRTNEIAKDSLGHNGETGIFGTQVNYLYKSKEALKAQYKYILQVVIPGKDEIVASETFILGNMFVEVPRPNTQGTYNSPIKMENYLRPYTSEWQTVVYGKIYTPMLRFHYIEIDGGDTIKKYIDIDYSTQIADDLRMPDEYEGDKMKQAMGGADFFINVGEKIEVKPNVKRQAGYLDFFYFMGGLDLNTYIASSESGNAESSNQYSNIKNGVGIFAARYTYVIENKTLSDLSIDSLAYGYYTKDLNFANFKGVWPPTK